MTPLDYEPQGKRVRSIDHIGAREAAGWIMWKVVGWIIVVVGGTLIILFLASR